MAIFAHFWYCINAYIEGRGSNISENVLHVIYGWAFRTPQDIEDPESEGLDFEPGMTHQIYGDK